MAGGPTMGDRLSRISLALALSLAVALLCLVSLSFLCAALYLGLASITSVLPYPDAVKGKKMAYRTLTTLKRDMKPMFKAWNKAWGDAGGPARKRRGKKKKKPR